MLNRAYSWLEVRAVDEEKRIIRGIATTPQIARDGDILESKGIRFKLPIPFLFNHNRDFPLGNVIEATTTESGIEVVIQVAANGVADFIDEKWRLIKNGVVRGLSIAWIPIKEHFDKTFGGFRITESDWMELSAVPVPADTNATILSVRSADESALAALGIKARSSPVRTSINSTGASVFPNGKTMTTSERITSLVNTRGANVARLTAIEEKIGTEGRGKDEAERQEWDELTRSVQSIDQELKDARDLQKLLISTATPVTPGNTGTQQRAAEVRGGSIVRVRPVDLPKGTGFTRYAIALFHAQGDRERAAQIVESNRFWMDQTPEVVLALRAPVAVGTTSTTGWAAELSPLQNLAAEFVEMLRPMTLIGRIDGFRRVPFNSLIPRQTAGTAGSWVGQGGRKPVGALALDSVELKPLKVAKIVAITQELERFSNPAAEGVVRRDLAEGIQETIDETFADPTVAAVSNVSPASIFNGASTSASAGGTLANFIDDIQTAEAYFAAQNISLGGLVIVTTETVGAGIGKLMNGLGVVAFPGIGATGGNAYYPVYTSNSVPSGIVGFFKPSEVFLADDGQAAIDISREATLIMDDGGSPSATNSVNLWQENKVGIKAERFINWTKRRPTSTYYLTSADYDGA